MKFLYMLHQTTWLDFLHSLRSFLTTIRLLVTIQLPRFLSSSSASDSIGRWIFEDLGGTPWMQACEDDPAYFCTPPPHHGTFVNNWCGCTSAAKKKKIAFSSWFVYVNRVCMWHHLWSCSFLILSLFCCSPAEHLLYQISKPDWTPEKESDRANCGASFAVRTRTLPARISLLSVWPTVLAG